MHEEPENKVTLCMPKIIQYNVNVAADLCVNDNF